MKFKTASLLNPRMMPVNAFPFLDQAQFPLLRSGSKDEVFVLRKLICRTTELE